MDKEEKLGNVKYYLRENPLSTSEENAYMAAVRRKEVRRQDQIVTMMTNKNTTISREEIELVLKQMKQIIKREILAGYPVIMDLFQAQVSIKGGFTDEEDEFDGRRHYVNVSMSANSDFKKELAQSAFIEKVDDRESKTKISKIYDYETRKFSDELAQGSLVSIKGKALLPDEGDPNIVFYRADTGEEFPVEKLFSATMREVMFHLPEVLVPGEYRVKIFVEKGLTDKAVRYGKIITIV